MKLVERTEGRDTGTRCVSKAAYGAGFPLCTHASALSRVSDKKAFEHNLHVSLYFDIVDVVRDCLCSRVFSSV